MSIARQGWKMIGASLAAAAIGFSVGPMGWPVATLAVVFAAFCAYFFRDPERRCPGDPAKVYSPGDGRVLSVAREGTDEALTVRVFLSIFDVHVQRSPCSGVVDGVRFQEGSFAMAMKDESRVNARSIVRIKPDGGRPALVAEQIAGYVARRIETWVKPGDAVKAGERYGIIYFGSQVAVHLPPGCRPLVAAGDRVAAGLTEIAEWTA